MGGQVFSHGEQSRAPSHVTVTWEDNAATLNVPLLPPPFPVTVQLGGKENQQKKKKLTPKIPPSDKETITCTSPDDAQAAPCCQHSQLLGKGILAAAAPGMLSQQRQNPSRAEG